MGLLISGVRAFILYVAMLVVMRLMGKSAIGQLEPYEFVLVILIADLISVPMEDIAVPIYAGILPLATIMATQILFSWLALKTTKWRRIISGEPSVLINKGIIDEQALKNTRINIDDVIEQVRFQGYPNLSEIKYAIVEVSGNISVIADVDNDNQKSKLHLPGIIVNDGKLLEDKMNKLNISMDQINKVLKQKKISSYKHCLVIYRETDGRFFVQVKQKYQGVTK